MKVTILLLALALPVTAEWVDLWPDQAPGAKRPALGSEKVTNAWRFTNVEVPQYFLFQPDEPTGAAVVVLPGGGYSGLAADHEGKQVGEWFAKRGVTALVVKYRVGRDDSLGYHFPVPQLDARRAIRTVRANAKDWKVDPAKVGVMGFSAGGHLASTTLTMFDDRFEKETTDQVDQLSCRPDFGILCYPVIAMGQPYCHGGSVRRLLGPEPSKELLDRNNTAARVTAKTPPCFIVHSADDMGVPLRNSAEFAARCAENKVPVVCHFFSEGGHGYGLSGRGDSATWTEQLEKWMTGCGWITPPR